MPEVSETTASPEDQDQPGRAEYRSTDPAVMRALAHPLRIEIMEILDEVTEATASEIAAKLDQSVANCSFHLRILAGGRFIERAEPRGREKPWRSIHKSRDMRPDRDDPTGIAESTELGALYVQREAARVIKFLREAPAYMKDRTWVPAVTVNTSTFWATPEEMAELAEDIKELVDRFEGRRDPANRPAGATKGRFFATLNPDLDELLARAQDVEAAGDNADGSSDQAP